MSTRDLLAVETRNVRRSFGGRDVLGGIDLTIHRGEFVALLGPSGCGKSTLLRALSDLDAAVTGDIRAPANRSVVFQEPRLLPWKRVWKNVALGLSGARHERRRRALSALEEVALAARDEAWPVTLSGGEAQRVALARALVQEPELLLLDEPFGALDALTKIRMHALLARLLERHRPAVLLVTHDVDEAILLSDRAVVLGTPAGAAADVGSQIVADIPIRLATPRRRTDPAFAELRRRLFGYLGVEDDDRTAAVSGVRSSQTRSTFSSEPEALELLNATS
ncbi:MAG TPA: ABC transporter ATP-binding protein [Polyangiaceae bacterium]|jgi:sulfonate transport system ATP-binding protein|nr:ABC transporter ATP-binding protein [Polyangiaceae bacterium]